MFSPQGLSVMTFIPSSIKFPSSLTQEVFRIFHFHQESHQHPMTPWSQYLVFLYL